VGNEASGDDEAVGAVADSGPRGESRSQPAPLLPPPPPPWTGFGSGAPDEKKMSCRMESWFGGAVGRDFLRRRPLKPFGGRVEML
jgi:hypothetical protein